MHRIITSFLPAGTSSRWGGSCHRQRAGALGRRALSVVESLEPRLLLYAWTTVYLPPQNTIGHTKTAMATDAVGNVYAAGIVEHVLADGSTTSGGVVDEKLSGKSDWQTIEDLSNVSLAFTSFDALAVDRAGNLYVGGNTRTGSLVLERPAGQTTFSTVDQVADVAVSGLAVDSAGDVYAVGRRSTTGSFYDNDHWIVRKRVAGQSAFATVDDAFPSDVGASGPAGVTIVAGGAAAGIYVAGFTREIPNPVETDHWRVRKSVDGGKTWSTVDDYLGPAGTGSEASAVCSDPAGILYVVGMAVVSTTQHWIVRKSVDGGASWTTDDDYQRPNHGNGPMAVAADAAGNVYVAGGYGIVRSNAGGSWATVDNFPEADYWSLAIDAGGTLYVGGIDFIGTPIPPTWIVRSSPGPASSKVTLDFNYLLVLAQHYGGPGAFATGDLNNDGTVGFDDLLILAQRYGQTISPMDPATGPAVAADVAAASFPSAAVPAPSTADDTHRGRRHIVVVMQTPSEYNLRYDRRSHRPGIGARSVHAHSSAPQRRY